MTRLGGAGSSLPGGGQAQARPTPAARVLKPALLVLLAACLARLWLMPLGSSFWVDEMATVFVVEHGADHPSFAAAPQVPASIYYALPRGAAALLGASEPVYRLPSVLAMALALWIVARLAARLIHPRAGWFAAFVCLGLSGFNFQAADARPYALGTCIAAAGALFLVRWLDSGRLRDAAAFAVCGALLWRVHLIYWPFYLVYATYAAVRLWRRETRAGWPEAAAVFAAIGAALVPVALNAVALFREAPAHVIAKPPSLHAFEHALRWNLPLICGAAAWLLYRFVRWKPERGLRRGSSLALILGWWLAQPVCLFAFSWITGNSVFVPRYLFIMLPGVGLAATAAAARFLPAGAWRPAAAAAAVAVLLVMGQWNLLWPAHEHSDWRAAAGEVSRAAAASRAAVICPSPFIEARPPVWRPDYPLPGFLYSHLPVYPIAGAPYLFPFESSPEAERNAAALARDVLSPSARFVLYGGNGAVRFWRRWFAARPELAGWHYVRRYFGDVEVDIFEK